MLKSAARLSKREPRRLRFNKKWLQISSKYALCFHSNVHQRNEKHFKHQSIYPQQYHVEGKIYIRSKIVSWWLLGCILEVLFATSVLTSSLTFRFSICLFHAHSHRLLPKRSDQRLWGKEWRSWEVMHLPITEHQINIATSKQSYLF